LIVGLLVYKAVSSSFAIGTSNSFTRTWRALTCWSLGIAPWKPWLIIFHHSLTRMFLMRLEMASLKSSTSIDCVENSSQPRDAGCSDCRYAFHRPYHLFCIQALRFFTTFGSRILIPIRRVEYISPPETLGFGCGKYISHLSMLPGRSSGVLIGGGRSSTDSYSLRLCGNTTKLGSSSTKCVTKSSSESNTATIRFTGSFGIGSCNDAQKMYGCSLSQSVSSMIGQLREGGIHQRAAHGKFFNSSQVFLIYLPGIPGYFIKIIDLLLRMLKNFLSPPQN